MAKPDGHGHQRGTSDAGLGPKARLACLCCPGVRSRQTCLGTADPGRQISFQDQELVGLPRLPAALLR